MKKTLQLFIAILCIGNLNAQTFTENPIYDEDKITERVTQGELFDFDGDGDQDFLVSGSVNESRLMVFVNDGNNLDSLHIIYDYPTMDISDFTIADFDNDGDADIVILKKSTAQFYVHENIGGGNYLAPVSILNAPLIATILEKGDVDGDGLIDFIFATSLVAKQSYWSKNLGNLTFDTADTLIDGTSTGNNRITALKAIDIDTDGDLDVVTIITTAYGSSSFVSVNDGSGNFATTNTPGQNIRGSIDLKDFNGDGYIDFGLATQDGIRKAMIYFNDQSNTFTNPLVISQYSAGEKQVAAFSALDFDNDGDQDVLVGYTYGYYSAGGGTVFLNDGIGNFTNSQKTITNTLFAPNSGGINRITQEIYNADINADGRVDIITKSNGDGDIILHTQNADSTFNSFNYLNHFMGVITRLQHIDIDGDGNKDIVSIAGASQGKMQVSYGDGNGNFLQQQVIHDNVYYSSSDALITDWDNNGQLDMFFSSSNKVFIHSNFQNSALDNLFLLYTSNPGQPTGTIGVQNNASNALYLADIDNDGDNDLVITDCQTSGGQVVWAENLGGLSFTIHTLIPTEIDSYALGDLDGDNDIDFVGAERIGSSNTELKTYLFDSGSKTFVLDQSKTTTSDMRHQFVLADPDNDNDLDIIFGYNFLGIKWFENSDGLGTLLTDTTLISIGFNGLSEIVATDLNNDNLIDFIASAVIGGESGVIPIINQGNNTFSVATNIPSLSQVAGNRTLIADDIDSDGVVDIVATGIKEGTGSHYPVWFRTCFPTSSAITETAYISYTSPSGNYTWTISDTYTDTIPNTAGCDSIITINLTIQTLPLTFVLQNASVNNGQAECYNATDTIIVAGSGTTVDINSGGEATFIAGERVLLKPGFHSHSGSTSSIYITTTADYCSSLPPLISTPDIVAGEHLIDPELYMVDEANINIYPNPTTGHFTIDFLGEETTADILLLNFQGASLMEEKCKDQLKIDMDISNLPTGMYIVVIKTQTELITKKIIKNY